MQTRANVSLTPALLRDLATAPAPCITVAIQPSGNARARLKDAMRQIETDLKASDPTLGEKAFLPFRQPLDDLDPDLSRHSLIVLSSPDHHHVFQTDRPVTEIVSVDEVFHLRSLLPLLNEHVEFYILALSQKHARLLRCTESESGEVALAPGTPSSLDESRQTRKPDHDQEDRSSGGPGAGHMKGVLFGTSSDADNKYEYLLNYFHELDRGVKGVLQNSKMPLIVAGVEHELALYRRVNTYPEIVEPGVHGAPDGLKGGELHRRALELLQSNPPAVVHKILDSVEKLAGTGHASHHAKEIVKAAYEGRVAHLFLQESAEYLGNFDETRRKVKKHGDDSRHDLLNEAVVETLRHGGDVRNLPSNQMPNGVPVCAVFRYPAPELQAAMRSHTNGSGEPS